jgi:hypothetical protein
MTTVVDGKSDMSMPKSKCCTAMIQAKIEQGQIQYFYCSVCKNEVDPKELNPKV